jgi:nucleotide-binding universal stress UspA family protein
MKNQDDRTAWRRNPNMEAGVGQKILVALDDSINAIRTIEFIARTFSPSENDITLFSVLPDTAALCDMNSPELTPLFLSQHGSCSQLEGRQKQIVNEALQQARDVLVRAGFDKDRIYLKVQVKKSGIARDIIEEAHCGYSIVVMGRRGLSGVQEFLLGSVSQKVIHAVKDISVIIVN